MPKRVKNKVAPDAPQPEPERKAGAPRAAAVTRWDDEAERRRALAERREAAAEPVRLEVTAENVVAALAQLAFYDPRNVYAVDGKLKKVNELDAVTARALAGMDVAQDGTVVKYRLANRVPALDLLGKYLKLFEGDVKDKGALDRLLAEFRKQYETLTTKEEEDGAG